MMSPFDTFLMYSAMRNHFRSNYDYFKYQGKVNVSFDHFNTRKDKFIFMKLCRMYDETDMKDLFVSNFVREHPRAFWVGDLVTDISKDCFLKWQKIGQSLTYIFENDLNKLFDGIEKPNDIFKIDNGQYPIIFTRYAQHDITIQTLCILNRIMNFIPKLKGKFKEDFVWDTQFIHIVGKTQNFIEFNASKMKSLLTMKMKEITNV